MKEIIIKKPKQKRSQHKFEAVLQALPRIIQESGYEKATTAAIALDADIGIGSLYDYFSCKEAIVVAYLDYALQQALDGVAYYAKHSALNWQTILQELVRSGIEFAHEHKTVLKIILLQPELLQSIDLTGSKIKIAEIAMEFAQNTQLEISHQQIDLLIYSMTNTMLGFQFRIAFMNDESYPKETVTKELSQILTNYITPFIKQ